MSEYIFTMKEVVLHGGYKDSIPCEKKEEIVRCRDCKYYDNEPMLHERWCQKLGIQPSVNAFCSWGVRRND